MKKYYPIILLFLTPFFVSAQKAGHVNGHIIDSYNEAAPFVTIRLLEINKTTTTNEEGYFDFFKVPTGNYTLEVSGIGFEATKQNILVEEAKRTTLYLQLNKLTNTLKEVVINGVSMKRYNATTTSNSKLPVNLLDLPLTLRVIDRGLIDDKQAVEFRQIVKNISGVTLTTGNGDFMIRGFQHTGGGASGSAQLINGSRNFFTGYTNDLNLANIERVEILKGPSSVLFGANSPGGSFNMITKKPLAVNKYNASASFGSWGRYRLDADLTGSVTRDKKLLYRFNAGYQNNSDYRDFIYNRNILIAPALRYQPSEKTTIDIEFVYNQIQRSTWYDWGVPTWNNDVLAVPIGYTAHEPTDGVNIRNNMLMIQLQQQLTSNLHFFSVFNGSSHFLSGQAHSPSFFNPIPNPADSMMSRVYRDVQENNTASFFSNYLVWKPVTGNVKFNLTAGVDYYQNKYYYDIKQAGAFDGVPSINIFKPVYRQKSTASYAPVGGFNDFSLTDFVGVYAMGLIELSEKLKVMLSGRYDSYRFRNYPSKTPNNTKPFLPNAGISYQPVKGLSFYGSWNKGFLPQNTQTPDFGGPFDPEYSGQLEAGIKREFLNGRYSLTAAYYTIDRKNVLVPKDPVNDPYGIKEATGKALSKGVEIDFAGNVLPNLNINAGYAYNDSRITRSVYAIEIKRQANNAPYHSAHFWARYNFIQGGLKGFGLALGGNYVGDRTTDGTLSYPSPALQKLPGYSTLDAGLFYRYQNMLVSVNLDNIFDEQYIYGALNAFYMQRGLPRNVLCRIQFSF